MKKTIFSILIVIFFVSSIPSYSFAITTDNKELNTLEHFKSELNGLLEDGTLTSREKKSLEERTTSEVVEEFVYEKLDQAVDILSDENSNARFLSLENGEIYKREVYDLGDGCNLIVELEDEAVFSEPGISTYATSGSNTLWKKYGSRYFTASATVDFSLGSVMMQLRNYYILSSKGIDEDKGTGTLTHDTVGGIYSVSDPKITDSIARTVGASDVNMECQYTLKSVSIDDVVAKRVYKITSTVGFVDINKAEEKIKVKQSWALTRIT